MNFVLGRLKDYALRRLQEPTTWAGIIAIVAGQLHWNVSPEVQAQLAQVGVTVGGLLLILAREGRNKPDNPTLTTAVKGALPPDPPKAIVPPPATDRMQPVQPGDHLAVDPAGVVHDDVPPHAKPVDPTLAHRPGFHQDGP